jgi:hypothetical protein
LRRGRGSDRAASGRGVGRKPERPMSPVALIVIVLFLIAMGALNLIEFGRVD